MIRGLKKTIAIALVAAFVLTAFAGCGKKEVIDEKAVAMTVGDTKVSAGFLQFYMRYQQSLLESYFGSMGEDKTVWTYTMEDGSTREEALKDSILEQLQEMYIIQAHAKDYDVKIEELEQEYLESVAEEFEKENSKDAKEKAYATKEYATEYFELIMYVVKVRSAMKKDIDINVDLEEAKQKRISYMAFEKTEKNDQGESVTLSDKELKKQKEAAEDFLAKAKAKGNLKEYATEAELSSKTLTFDKDTKTLASEVIKKADELKVNEFSGVIDAEDAYYVVQLETLYDEEATDAKIEGILEQRGEDRYEELLEEWKKDVKITVDEDIVDAISFNDLKINYIEDEEKEESTESTEGTDSAETNTEE